MCIVWQGCVWPLTHLRRMISGVFIYNHKGDCIISRLYRDDIT